jgi:redox-sensing transcriptional repressor
VIVGVGNLGRALANYRGFGERGFRVSALVDIDESKIGKPVDSMVVEDFADLERIVKEREISIGIVATTAGAAQDAADRLVSAGVKSILNFAPTVLQVPDDVSLRKVDLSIELQILSFYEQRKSALDTVRRGKRLTASASKSTRP